MQQEKERTITKKETNKIQFIAILAETEAKKRLKHRSNEMNRLHTDLDLETVFFLFASLALILRRESDCQSNPPKQKSVSQSKLRKQIRLRNDGSSDLERSTSGLHQICVE